MLLIDGSYIDFWWLEIQEGRFAHHWNRHHVNGTIHRHDNSPHRKWRHIKTFPQHYHCEREDSVYSAAPQRGRGTIQDLVDRASKLK